MIDSDFIQLAFDAFQIHWLSIINSVVLVFLLTGFVVIILVNTYM